jgi:hypothetical protein
MVRYRVLSLDGDGIRGLVTVFASRDVNLDSTIKWIARNWI